MTFWRMSIIFYKEIKGVVPQQKVCSALDKIIEEEEKHLFKLKNMRRKIDPKYAKLETVIYQ